MDRRSFLASLAGAASLSFWAPSESSAFDFEFFKQLGRGMVPDYVNCGWLDSYDAKRTFVRSRSKPYFRQWDQQVRGTGAGKRIYLWKFYEKVTGKPFVARQQLTVDCVGFAYALACDTLGAIQSVTQNHLWLGDCSSETIYAGSKVEIGQRPVRGGGGGSNGVWAANWLQKYGVVYRKKYGDIDLTKYDPSLARKWASTWDGVPSILEEVAKEHPIGTIARIENFDQGADAIANGYPVIICSSQGFNTHRDEDGCLRPVAQWNHAMLWWGIDTLSKRRTGNLANSWGPYWVDGPEGPNGCPSGSFWVDDYVIDRMLKQNDSYVISDLRGFQRRVIEYPMY